MSQELNTKSIDQDTLFKKKTILKRGGSEIPIMREPAKRLLLVDLSIVSKASSYDKSDYYMVVDQHIDEINQKMLFHSLISKIYKLFKNLGMGRKSTANKGKVHNID